MDRLPAERSQAGDRIAMVSRESDNKQTDRLYPSLPNTERCEGVEPDRSIREKLLADAVDHPGRLLGDTQSEMSAANSDGTMKVQIAILEEQRRELLSINEQWAKEYQTMVQYYKEKSGNGDVTPELLRAEQEAEQLRVQNSSLTRRGQHQHQEIRRLNKALEGALQTPLPVGEGSDTQEEVWKHQAQVYKEDFLKERRDREKLKGKHLELERRFRIVNTELHNLKVTPSSPQPVHKCTCTHRANQPTRDGNTYPRASPNTQHCCQLQRHKPHS
ncbi:TNFAIP3-interacting protein 1-like [Centroberyx affinis]|uniref:TNFAIP3-interacting protein 1-like n=1 Tax=Centroberyx affinis TaxID=166261 RepID=UPI003A5C7764